MMSCRFIVLFIVYLLYESTIAIEQFNIQNRVRPSKGIWSFLFGTGPELKRCDNCYCGVMSHKQGKLIGGSRITPHEFPWMAVIYLKGALPVSGTLINEQFVLTSASQIAGATPFDMEIILGSFDLCFPESTQIKQTVKYIFINPEYKPNTRDNNIALLKLAVPIKANSPNIAPICLPTPGKSYTGKTAIVSSFLGIIDRLKEERKICIAHKVRISISTDTIGYTFGVVGYPTMDNILCQSDAGTGITYQSPSGYYELVGVLSDEHSCIPIKTEIDAFVLKGNKTPIKFIRVEPYLNWILSITSDNCFCNKP